jgi:hypothetical protein
MTNTDHPRPVWLTRKQRDSLSYSHSLRYSVVQQWDAAPAEPMEVMLAAILADRKDAAEMPGWMIEMMRGQIKTGLRALGMPEVTA